MISSANNPDPAAAVLPILTFQSNARSGATMDEEQLNASLRKFLKTVGVTAQREIEKAVRQGVESGKLKGSETLPAQAKISINGVDLHFQIDGEIKLG